MAKSAVTSVETFDAKVHTREPGRITAIGDVKSEKYSIKRQSEILPPLIYTVVTSEIGAEVFYHRRTVKQSTILVGTSVEAGQFQQTHRICLDQLDESGSLELSHKNSAALIFTEGGERVGLATMIVIR